jgi:Methyltransferase FkbM domain
LDRDIDAVNAALWARNEPLRLQRGPNNMASKVIPNGVGNVASLTIPDLLTRFNLPRIDILKLDIEGAEEYLFRDAGCWLKNVNAIIFECNPGESPTAVQALFRGLADAQFKVFVSRENLVCIRASTDWAMINTADYRI